MGGLLSIQQHRNAKSRQIWHSGPLNVLRVTRLKVTACKHSGSRWQACPALHVIKIIMIIMINHLRLGWGFKMGTGSYFFFKLFSLRAFSSPWPPRQNLFPMTSNPQHRAGRGGDPTCWQPSTRTKTSPRFHGWRRRSAWLLETGLKNDPRKKKNRQVFIKHHISDVSQVHVSRQRESAYTHWCHSRRCRWWAASPAPPARRLRSACWGGPSAPRRRPGLLSARRSGAAPPSRSPLGRGGGEQTN